MKLKLLKPLLLNDITLINEKIASIHDLGMKVSMDDFGTGSSTFSNLKHVDIDVLKIDRFNFYVILKLTLKVKKWFMESSN